MAESTAEADHNNAAFCLPTHFLTDDDFLAGDHPRLQNPTKSFDLFSGGFDPFGPPSALDSPVSSSETEPERDLPRDDELLAELTRQLAQSTLQKDHYKSNPKHNPAEKPWGFSTSPQSTLTGFGPWSNRSGFSSNGSPNGPSRVPSPPLTPPGAKNDAAWELLYEAAGQVARMKMNAIAAAAAVAQMNRSQQNRGLPCKPPKCHPINGFYDRPNTNRFEFQGVKRQGNPMWAQGRQEIDEWYCQHHQPRRCCDVTLGLPQSAWPPLSGGAHPQPHHHHHNNQRQQGGGPPMRAVFLGGSGLGVGAGPGPKKSAGTGVFLPRRPMNQQPPEPRRKPTGGSPVMVPARVVHALNLDLHEMNNGANLSSQSRFGCGFVTDHEILMARRNSMIGQPRSIRRDGASATMGAHEVCLPNDWTY